MLIPFSQLFFFRERGCMPDSVPDNHLENQRPHCLFGRLVNPKNINQSIVLILLNKKYTSFDPMTSSDVQLCLNCAWIEFAYVNYSIQLYWHLYRSKILFELWIPLHLDRQGILGYCLGRDGMPSLQKTSNAALGQTSGRSENSQLIGGRRWKTDCFNTVWK